MWAIARDGAVFYRGSVSAQNPAGARESKTRACLQCFMSTETEYFVFKQNVSTLITCTSFGSSFFQHDLQAADEQFGPVHTRLFLLLVVPRTSFAERTSLK